MRRWRPLTKMCSENESKKKSYGPMLANVLITPGSGTMMVGLKVQGTLQILMALSGLCLSLIWLLGAMVEILKTGSLDVIVEAGLTSVSFWVMGVGGVGVFLLAMVWSLVVTWIAMKSSSPFPQDGS